MLKGFPALFLTYLGILFCLGCDSDDNNGGGNCDAAVILSSSQYSNSQSAIFSLNSINIEGDCMLVNYSSSGCDGESWSMRLVDSEAVLESLPPQRELRLIFTNDEACLAFITTETGFDIKDLQIEGFQTVILNISNDNSSITYEY